MPQPHPDVTNGSCLHCHSYIGPWDREVTKRAVSGFLTTDQVAEVEAQLCENWTGDQIDAAPPGYADRLHPACLTLVMAAAV